jgi:hypothetical protein
MRTALTVWDHRPLVIVNGCSTAAFTPKALSPFVRKFTRDGGAGGVVATEVLVHKTLAADIAFRFLERVLDGNSVSAGLLAVRRSLLARNNPLGLIYTLFAFSDLAVTGRAGLQQSTVKPTVDFNMKDSENLIHW